MAPGGTQELGEAQTCALKSPLGLDLDNVLILIVYKFSISKLVTTGIPTEHSDHILSHLTLNTQTRSY